MPLKAHPRWKRRVPASPTSDTRHDPSDPAVVLPQRARSAGNQAQHEDSLESGARPSLTATSGGLRVKRDQTPKKRKKDKIDAVEEEHRLLKRPSGGGKGKRRVVRAVADANMLQAALTRMDTGKESCTEQANEYDSLALSRGTLATSTATDATTKTSPPSLSPQVSASRNSSIPTSENSTFASPLLSRSYRLKTGRNEDSRLYDIGENYVSGLHAVRNTRDFSPPDGKDHGCPLNSHSGQNNRVNGEGGSGGQTHRVGGREERKTSLPTEFNTPFGSSWLSRSTTPTRQCRPSDSSDTPSSIRSNEQSRGASLIASKSTGIPKTKLKRPGFPCRTPIVKPTLAPQAAVCATSQPQAPHASNRIQSSNTASISRAATSTHSHAPVVVSPSVAVGSRDHDDELSPIPERQRQPKDSPVQVSRTASCSSTSLDEVEGAAPSQTKAAWRGWNPLFWATRRATLNANPHDRQPDSISTFQRRLRTSQMDRDINNTLATNEIISANRANIRGAMWNLRDCTRDYADHINSSTDQSIRRAFLKNDVNAKAGVQALHDHFDDAQQKSRYNFHILYQHIDQRLDAHEEVLQDIKMATDKLREMSEQVHNAQMETPGDTILHNPGTNTDAAAQNSTRPIDESPLGSESERRQASQNTSQEQLQQQSDGAISATETSPTIEQNLRRTVEDYKRSANIEGKERARERAAVQRAKMALTEWEATEDELVRDAAMERVKSELSTALFGRPA